VLDLKGFNNLLQWKNHPCTMNPTPHKENNNGVKAHNKNKKRRRINLEPKQNAVTKIGYGARQKKTQTITTTESAHRGSQPRLWSLFTFQARHPAHTRRTARPFSRSNNRPVAKSATMPPFIPSGRFLLNGT
jgi:hypothetical protein